MTDGYLRNNPYSERSYHPFNENDKWEAQHDRRIKWLTRQIKNNPTIKLTNLTGSQYALVTSSIKGSKYQITTFDANDVPIMDSQRDTLKEVVEELDDLGFVFPEKILVLINNNLKSVIGEKQLKDTIKYTPERLENILGRYGSKSSPNYSQAYIAYMSPDDFLSLTTTNLAKIERESRELNLDDLYNETQDIFLKFDMDDKEVTGHEGRHRMVALRNAGIKSVPVVLWQDGEKGKYNKIFMKNLRLEGEDFEYSKASGNVDIKNLVPTSRKYEECLKRFFVDNERKSLKDIQNGINEYKLRNSYNKTKIKSKTAHIEQR